MNSVLFSCVIPVKGPRPYFDEAVASLQSQGMGEELEVIVQDGDAEPDVGQSDALNKGFAKAKGEWLFWLNADDVLLPGALKKVRELISRVEGEGVRKDGRVERVEGEGVRKDGRVERVERVDGGGVESRVDRVEGEERNGRVDWIAGNTVYIDTRGTVTDVRRDARWYPWYGRHLSVWTGGPSAFFRRGLWKQHGGFDVALKYVMDIDLWTRWARTGERFATLNDYVWGFRIHSGSKTMGGKNVCEYRTERVALMDKFGVRNEIIWRNLTRAASMIDGSWLKRQCDARLLSGRNWKDVVR